MQIGVIGATGTIGSRVVSEALSRGHHVTAFSRDAAQIQDSRENITWKSVDVTDAEGIAALAEMVRPLGYEVIEARLRDCLHLKTGATYAGDGVLLYNERCVDPAQFAGVEPVAVSPDEPAAANCVRAGETVIMPAGNRNTTETLRTRGFKVVEVDVSELQKAESGVTCMSLIDDRP